MATMKMKALAGTLLALVGVAGACGGSDTNESFEASNNRIQSIIERSLRNQADGFDRSLSHIKDSSTFADAADQVERRTRVCTDPAFRTTDDNFGRVGCAVVQDPLELTFRNDVEGLIEDLDRRFFVDANVASSDGDTVVYDLHGPTVCGDAPDACAADVDASEVRITARRTGEQSVRAVLKVGPQRLEPAVVRFAPRRISLKVRLSALRETLAHVSQATGTELRLPETMKGVSTWIAKTNDSGLAEFHWRVDEQIEVDAERWGLAVAPADPALRANVDRSSDSGLLEVALSESTLSWVRGTGGDRIQHRLAAAALGAVVEVDDTAPSAQLRDIHVGGEPATLDAGGETVGTFTLTPETGDAFSGTVEWTDDQLDVQVEPTFEVALDMKFKAVADRLEDYAEWAYDSVTRLQVQGANSAKGRFVHTDERTDYFRMNQGTAIIEATGNTQFKHEVRGDRCLVGSGDSPTGHPLEGYATRTCP